MRVTATSLPSIWPPSMWDIALAASPVLSYSTKPARRLDESPPFSSALSGLNLSSATLSTRP